MTSTDLKKLRGVLEARQAELEYLLGHREAIAVESNADTLDQIQHASERDMAIGNLEREYTRLHEVRGALDRIRTGSFGICLDCEEEVSMKRLNAIPSATLCLACREAVDRNRILAQNPSETALLQTD
jgi:DnaK suppressor protein